VPNIWQEKAAEYSADNKYSAQGSKHCKNVNLYKEKIGFLWWQLQVAFDGHDLYATETYIHKTLTMSTKSLLSREKIACEMKSYYTRLFRFRQHLPNIRPIIFGRVFGRKRFWSITNCNVSNLCFWAQLSYSANVASTIPVVVSAHDVPDLMCNFEV
jgi:hypothetical protein